MEFTGERFVPGTPGPIKLEHLQRYALCREAVRGKRVLDIACGEGYGSAMLGATAARVLGIDIDPAAVEHARTTYGHLTNVEFCVGACDRTLLPDGAVDVVVSFETIEHHVKQGEMIREVRRVLAPGGLFILSSPHRPAYSAVPPSPNPFHVRELTFEELEALLKVEFAHVRFWGQRLAVGCFTYALGRATDESPQQVQSLAVDGHDVIDAVVELAKPVYLLAACSETPVDLKGLALDSVIVEPADDIHAQIEAVIQDHVKIHQQGQEAADALKKQLKEQISHVAALQAELLDLRPERGEAQAAFPFHAQQGQPEDRVKHVAALQGELLQLRHERAEEQAILHAEQASWEAERRRSAAEVDELQHELVIFRGSRSWRVTSPLRAAVAVMRRSARRVRRIVSTMARRLRDRASRLVHQWPRLSRGQRAPAGRATNSGDSVVANGTVEWADYPRVRHRIDVIKRKQLASVNVAPPRLITLGRQDFRSAARRVRLPDPGPQPDVSIIIPAYNNLTYTLECLLSICAHTGNEIRYEVIVADDASTDDTRPVLSTVPRLRLVSNDVNLGFLRNCNRAAGLANGRYLLFLNSDTQVTRGWLEPMLRVFQDERDVGAVGPMIVFPDGRLQEAGARIRRDATADMVGLFDSPANPRFRYRRDVEYCSGACVLLETGAFRELGGFDERYAPAYCEDSDLGLRLRQAGRRVIYCPDSVVVHHLSVTTNLVSSAFKSQCIVRNVQQLKETWQEELDRNDDVRVIAFYLPQFHRIPENDQWWGAGFTEWSNVTKARPNFVGHRQPRVPADLGYYDLRVPDVMEQQAALARRYGIHGFCYYYYWFHGKRLLEAPLERMLATGQPDLPFCLCWANENWTRRWDGRDDEVLMAQDHSTADDEAVIRDLMRYFQSSRYIRVRGKPLVLVYRVTLFPDFARTARIWRRVCRAEGIGEIYIAMVESFELVKHSDTPARYGCDAGVEFPPHGMADMRPPSSQVINPKFRGTVADYRDLAVRFATRAYPRYTRFLTVMPGWDNTPRRQDESFSFEHAMPGTLQAWAETAIETTKQQCVGDERLLFVNAWNEWAEGAYLEPDRMFGHTFLEAILNARDASALIARGQDSSDGSAP